MYFYITVLMNSCAEILSAHLILSGCGFIIVNKLRSTVQYNAHDSFQVTLGVCHSTVFCIGVSPVVLNLSRLRVFLRGITSSPIPLYKGYIHTKMPALTAAVT